MGQIYKICILFALVFATQFAVAQTIDSLNTDSNQTIKDSIVQTSSADSVKIESNNPVTETTITESTNTNENKDSLNVQDLNSTAPDSVTTQDIPVDNTAVSEPKTEDLFDNFVPNTPAFSDTVIVSFVKENVTQSPDSLYFNVLKITNYKQNSVRGELMLTAPDGWNIISASGNVINLASGDSAYIPVRLAIDNNAVGASSYVLNATLKIENEVFSSNAYITIPGYKSWSMKVDKSIVVFNPYHEVEEIKIKLSNKGNVTETIKIEYRIGDLLIIDGVDEFSNISYIMLNSNTDTTILFSVKQNYSISSEERLLLERNWKESSVDVFTSTFDKKQKHVVWFKHLNSSFYGTKLDASSPLNFGITASNLLSGQPIRFNVEIFGALLLPKQRTLRYALTAIGLGLDSDQMEKYNFKKHIKFSANYVQNNVSIIVGNNMSTGIGGIGLSGVGFKTIFNFSKKGTLSFGAAGSLYSKNAVGGFVSYTKNILGIGFRTGFGFATFPASNKEFYSGLFGFNFKFLKLNSFSANVIKSTSSLSNILSNDSTMNGFGYSLGYSFGYKNFSLGIGFQNYIKFTRRIGQGINVQTSYKFKNRIKINGYFNRGIRYTDIIKYNLSSNELYNINDVGRVTISIPTNHSVSYSIGSQYTSFVQQSLDRTYRFISTTSTYNPKLSLSANRRLNKRISINASVTAGLAYIRYISEDTLINPIKMNNKGTYSFGTSFNSRNWRLSVSYNIGSVTDMWSYLNYHMMFPNYDIGGVMTESLIIRPIYEKTFFQNKIRTQLMANYTYFRPSGRESFSVSSNNFFILNKGWSLSINANMYSSSVIDEKMYKISSKNVNIQLGLRKSFDIQQPRLKHYDLTLVCFNDLNGNKIKDENEPPMPNIQVSFERTSRTDDPNLASQLKTNFALIELITSPDGETFYGNIPQGNYRIVFTPLFDLKDLYNVNGEEQIISILSENTTVYVPYAETYKLKGKVHIERDEFSSEGAVSPEGIRITATNPTGESFSVLTDKNGDYVLSVPQAQTYSVKVNNVFNDQFICEKDQYSVHFNGLKVFRIDFKFVEKKRKINFNTNIDQFYIFQSLSSTQVPNQQEGIKSFKTDIDTTNVLNYIDAIMDSKAFANPDKVNRDKQIIPVTSVSENGLIFKVQLFNPDTKKRTYGEVKSFPQVICIDGENGNLKYLSGSYTDFKKAKEFVEELKQFGLNDAQVVPFKDKKQISLQEAGVE